MSIERIDPELCNGCGTCVTTCPMDVIRLDTTATEYPPCRAACPAGVDIRSYIYMLKNGMIEEAIDILRESLPFPAITGRVCPHPCEDVCARNEIDEAVNINALERYVADYWLQEKAKPINTIYSAKIAIAGSGPAGLSCAYFLVKKGYTVTVFETMPDLGGMLRYGIPEYRLPKNILNAQIEYIRDMGVEFKTSVDLNEILDLETLKKTYQAFFWAIGTQLCSKPNINGMGLDGVSFGLDFLRNINCQQEIIVPDRVVVIGGGNVAMDVALTALRSGAKEVKIACLEKGEEIPAFKEEINQVINEGITLYEGWGPYEVIGKNGKVTGIKLMRCSSLLDEKGDFNPCYDKTETKNILADMVIFAIGQTVDVTNIPKNIKTRRDHTIDVDPITLETSMPGVFSGGDIVRRAASVVRAIADGKNAAISINRYLKREDLKAGRYIGPKITRKPPKEGMETIKRNQTRVLDLPSRSANFNEIKIGFNDDLANLEAQRCMTCGSRAVIKYPEDCQLCCFCEMDCHQKAIFVSPQKKVNPLLIWG